MIEYAHICMQITAVISVQMFHLPTVCHRVRLLTNE